MRLETSGPAAGSTQTRTPPPTRLGPTTRAWPPVDAGRPSQDRGTSPGDPEGPHAWVVVIDVTTGLLARPTSGADVDAVGWDCGEGPTWGADAIGAARDPEADFGSVAGALGPPDFPCESLVDCTTSLIGGRLSVRTQQGDLRGCTVEIFEAADEAEDAFEVYLCPRFDARVGDCGPLLGQGHDGEHPVMPVR